MTLHMAVSILTLLFRAPRVSIFGTPIDLQCVGYRTSVFSNDVSRVSIRVQTMLGRLPGEGVELNVTHFLLRGYRSGIDLR